MSVKFVTDQRYPHLGGNLHHGDFNTLDLELFKVLVKRFAVATALDVGCGEGHLLWNLARMGVHAHGIDGLRLNVDRAVYPIAMHDLVECPYYMPVDMVVSIEVAEHVDTKYVDHYVDTLTNGNIVVMTHATEKDTGGHHHVNLQDEGYWLSIMREKGYRLDYYNDYYRAFARRHNEDSFFAKTGLILLKE
jgi:hypothetical protein